MNESVTTLPPAKAGTYKPMQPNPVKQLALRILNGSMTSDEKLISDHELLVAVIEELRTMGIKIAFVTGVWDMFHEGHGVYLEKGKLLAAEKYPESKLVLVVGYDTDDLTRKRKGSTRPIVGEVERARVLGLMSSVNILTPQYEVNQLYRVISHDVRIISESTTDLPSDDSDIRSQCQHLINLPPQSTTSTTQRIRKLTMDGGLETMEKVVARLPEVMEELRNEVSDMITDKLTKLVEEVRRELE